MMAIRNLAQKFFLFFFGVTVIAKMTAMAWAEEGVSQESSIIVSIINQVGLPIALVLLFLWFGIKYIWPYLEKQQDYLVQQIQTLQKAREDSQEKYLNSLSNLDKTLGLHFEKLVDKLNIMHEDIKGNRDVHHK